MLRILFVDDEPFILQGLSVLIDWEKEGFEIAGTGGSLRHPPERADGIPIGGYLPGFQPSTEGQPGGWRDSQPGRGPTITSIL